MATKEKEVVPSNTSPEATQARVIEKMKVKTDKAVKKANLTLERLKVEYVPVDFLKPNAYNPNRQSERDFELLKLSMQEDGFTQPILALPNGIIIDGEHRWRAAKDVGYKEIPTVFAEMSDEQMRISTLRHNRARGTEDVELTSMLLRDMEKLGAREYAKEALQLSDLDMEFLLGDISAPDALAGEEFSQAWEAVGVNEMAEDIDKRTEDGKSHTIMSTHGSPIVRSYSKKAANVMLELEKKLAGAKTAEERKKLKRKYSVYRVAFNFTGDEGRMVNKILGKKSSEKLFKLCSAEFKLMQKRGEITAKGKRVKKKEVVRHGRHPEGRGAAGLRVPVVKTKKAKTGVKPS